MSIYAFLFLAWVWKKWSERLSWMSLSCSKRSSTTRLFGTFGNSSIIQWGWDPMFAKNGVYPVINKLNYWMKTLPCARNPSNYLVDSWQNNKDTFSMFDLYVQFSIGLRMITRDFTKNFGINCVLQSLMISSRRLWCLKTSHITRFAIS